MANLRVTELDFDSIKANLKDFLRSQSVLNSYDFDGSAMSVLIDLLSYNTHYNAYLANMLANEMFLDSAVKRESAVSISRHLGFVPRSAQGAVTTVSFNILDNQTTASQAVLEKFSIFNMTINGTTFPFVNLEPLVSYNVNGNFAFNNVRLKQGTPQIFRFTVSNPGPSEKFIIPNSEVDTTTLSITVQKSATDSTLTTYTLVTSIDGVDGTTKNGLVCFLEENQFGQYQVYFGDGVVGKKLEAGNIVTIEYIISEGDAANSLPTEQLSFTLSTLPTNLNNNNLLSRSIISRPAYGANKHSLTEIKFLAPLIRAAQDRAVTKNDYEGLIQTYKPQIESISVWGGEDNDPPIYGKIFISAKPTAGLVLDEAVKDEIKNTILAKRKVLALMPEIIDPEYLYLGLDVRVKYNTTLASQGTSRLQSLIRLKTENYFNDELEKFNKDFVYYKYINELQNLDDSITSILVSLRIQRRVDIRINVGNQFSQNNNIKFFNRIHPNSVRSTYFTILDDDSQLKTVFFRDNAGNPPNYEGTGTLELWAVNATTQLSDLLLPNMGVVDYALGTIDTGQFTPRGFPTASISDLRFSAEVQESNFDVSVSKNVLLTLDDSSLDISAGLNKNGLNITVTPVTE